VASAASKFGLRGAAHASPAPAEPGPRPIPIEDIVELVRCICRLSAASCVKELVVTGTADVEV
jgi:hypothetical protein